MKKRVKRKPVASAKKPDRAARKRSPKKSKADSLLGFMAGKFDIVGDVESPLPDWKYWHPEKNL